MYTPYPIKHDELGELALLEAERLAKLGEADPIPTQEVVEAQTDVTNHWAERYHQTELAEDQDPQDVFGEATVIQQEEALERMPSVIAEYENDEEATEGAIVVWVKLTLQRTYTDMAHARRRLAELEHARDSWYELATDSAAELRLLEDAIETVHDLSVSVSVLGMYASSALRLMEMYRRRYPEDYRQLMVELTREYGLRADEPVDPREENYDFEHQFARMRKVLVENVDYAVLIDALWKRKQTIITQQEQAEQRQLDQGDQATVEGTQATVAGTVELADQKVADYVQVLEGSTEPENPFDSLDTVEEDDHSASEATNAKGGQNQVQMNDGTSRVSLAQAA